MSSKDVVILPVSTRYEEADEKCADMCDGSRVVGYEVYDHPDALHGEDVTEAMAKRHGVDYGDSAALGVWVLGKPEDVEAYLEENGYEEYQGLFGYGHDENDD
jgi:hypothetical protein